MPWLAGEGENQHDLLEQGGGASSAKHSTSSLVSACLGTQSMCDIYSKQQRAMFTMDPKLCMLALIYVVTAEHSAGLNCAKLVFTTPKQ